MLKIIILLQMTTCIIKFLLMNIISRAVRLRQQVSIKRPAVRVLTMSNSRKIIREKVIRSVRVLLSHVALTALLRQVAPASTMPKRATTPAPPHVNGPQGCSLQAGAAHIVTKGPPRSDKGEKVSNVS